MDKMTIDVSSLTIEYYVWKRTDIITIFFIAIWMLAWTNPFSADIIFNILYCTFLKPAWKCGPYDIDNIEKQVGVKILFICEDIKENVKIFFSGGRKNVF